MQPDLNVSHTKVSMMAATMTAIPAALAEALGHMQRAVACPEDVKARIAGLRVPVEEVAGTRGLTTNWRSGGSGQTSAAPPGRWAGGGGGGGAPAGSGDGWTVAGGGRRGGGGGGRRDYGHGGGGGGDWGRHGGGFRNQHSSGGGGTAPAAPAAPPPRRPYADRSAMPHFGNKARKDVTTEERMMDRIRDKMNKFSAMTYDATKAWLAQLLDSGETDFLTGFITMVFEKAASEPSFCALYARLLTELRAGFPHLDTELRRIFGEFLTVFEAAADEPDVGSEQYQAFLELRERRRYRRGYAAFIGEVAKLGAIDIGGVSRTCNIILDGLIAAKAKPDQGLLCEEYADCLTSLMRSCKPMLAPTVEPLIVRVKAAMDRTDSPSLTNKARFALMDLPELFA